MSAAPPVAPALLRLLQLASPLLPVGAYSYSQGLETAIAQGTVSDRDSAAAWIGTQLDLAQAAFEAPIWWRLYHAWVAQDIGAARRWNALFVATRDTLELRAETVQMGAALMRLVRDAQLFGPDDVALLEATPRLTWPAAFAFCAAGWSIAPEDGLAAYLWAWLEGQVTAAMKAVPLGQVAGQTLLGTLAAQVPAVVRQAAQLPDEALGSFLPGLSIASCAHETQYSRIFRS